MATQTQAELSYEARVALTRFLLHKVREEKYPSPAHLTLIERTITPDLRREYLDVLLEKAVTEKHPSIPMLNRLQRAMMSPG